MNLVVPEGVAYTLSRPPIIAGFAPPSCQPAPGRAVLPAPFGQIKPAKLGPEPIEGVVGGGPDFFLRPPRLILCGFPVLVRLDGTSAGALEFGLLRIDREAIGAHHANLRVRAISR